MTNLIVGIDLGTTNSLIGAMDAGFPVLFADADGKRLTPSVVTFPPEAENAGGHPLVGRIAARQRALHPRRTVFSIKRLMGARVGEATTSEAAADLPYKLCGATGAGVRVQVDESAKKTWSPEEISSLILKKLKSDAEAALGQEVSRAVITVPAYFNDAQRAATVAAGEMAGLHVERILNEPTAAALAYGLDKLGERTKIAVYDLGGGTFDLSILELNVGVFQVLSTNGNTRLGGDDIDGALVTMLAGKFGVAPGSDAFLRLRELARNAKEQLSDDSKATIYLPFTGAGAGATVTEQAAPASVTVTRDELEAVAKPVVEKTRGHCLRALADAGLSPADLQSVILVGGATRMPLVRRLVGEIFGRDPDTTQHPDEAVAIGATIQAGILSGAVRDVVLLDVTPLSLGIETFGGLTNVIVPRNTTIPTKAGEMFTNAVAGQSAVRIHVVQGERERAADNWTLGSFELAFGQPGPRGSARVGVQFEIDANGLLHVLARDTKTGAEQIVKMRSAVDVSDEAVEQMISESVEYAFDDYHARLLVETRLKSEEMLPAVRGALGMFAEDDERLGPEERAGIECLIFAVETAFKGEDYETLKQANAALDVGTQQLATLLMEQAMDDALRRRGLI